MDNTRRGFFGNILMGATKPLRQTGEKLNLISQLARGEDVERSYRPIFTTEDEARTMYANPVLSTAKDLASLASYGVGGGATTAATTTAGRIGQLAGRGAIGGALGGFGASEEGQEIQSALTGGLTGGVVGGGIGVLGSALSRIAGKKVPGVPTVADEVFSSQQGGGKVSSTLRNSLFKTTPKQADLTPQALGQAQDDFINVFRDVTGRTSFVADDLANASDDVIRTVSNRVDDIAANTSLTPGTGLRLKNRIASEVNLDKLNRLAGSDQRVKNAVDAVNSLSDDASALDLVNALRSVRRAAGGFKNLQGDQAGAARRLLQDIQGVLRDEVPDQVSGLLSRESNMINLSGNLLADVSRPTRIGAGALNLPVNLRGGVERAATTTAGLGDTVSRISGTIPSVSSRVPPLIATLAGTAAGGSLQGDADRALAESEVSNADLVSTLAGQRVQESPEQYQANLFLDLIAQGASTSEAGAIAEAMTIANLGGVQEPQELTEKQANAASAIDSLDTMESLLAEGGGGLLATSMLPFAGGSDRAQIYDAASENVKDILARMRTGAVISPNEEKLYQRYIPRLTDTSATRQFKLSQLRSIFNNIYSTGTGGNTQSLEAEL